MSSGYSLGGLLQVMSFSAFNSGNMKKAVDYAEESKRIFEEMGDYPMLKKAFSFCILFMKEKVITSRHLMR